MTGSGDSSGSGDSWAGRRQWGGSWAFTRLYLMVPTAALVEASIDINVYPEPRQSKQGCGDCEEHKSADDQRAFHV